MFLAIGLLKAAFLMGVLNETAGQFSALFVAIKPGVVNETSGHLELCLKGNKTRHLQQCCGDKIGFSNDTSEQFPAVFVAT